MKSLPLVLPALTLLAMGGCEQKPVAPPPPASAAYTEAAKTFAATSAYLDTGGDFYFYLRTAEILGGIPAEMDSWKDAILQTAGADLTMPRLEFDAWYALGKRTIIDTGVTHLHAFGISGIELEPGLNRIRSMAYSGEVADRGLLWNVGGRNTAHPFPALEFLPASTVYAAFTDFDPQVLWAFVEKVTNDIPDQKMRQQAKAWPGLAQIFIGMTPKDLFASIDSEFGLVVAADESATMDLPLQNGMITLPRTAGALLVRVKDNKFYDLIVTKLEELVGREMPVMKSDHDGLRLAKVQIPDLEMGIPLTPTIARFGDYVAISSTEELALQLARRGPKPPALMKDTPAFQRFAKLEKLEGNAFAYLSERGSGMLRTLQLRSMDAGTPIPPALKPKVEQLYDLFTQKSLFSIGRMEKGGYASTMYSPTGSKQLVATALIMPAAILGVVMVPAADAAVKAAKSAQALAELREIGLAMKLFEADNNVAAGTAISAADLEPYLSAATDLGKRLRAQPFVDRQGNPYLEFIAGSAPLVPAATAAAFPKQQWGEYAP